MDLLQCIIFLAWPVIALGYPLYMTIRTIETGSMYDKRKLVTYWTIFSFVYLFEHVFQKHLEWVPVWSYLRLIFMCWLVIPQFNGASYLYQNLVHPYLHLRLSCAVTQFYATCSEWFKKLKKDSYFKLEENGSGALEKLIPSKPEGNEGGQILGGIQVMECNTVKCDAPESNQPEGDEGGQILGGIQVMECNTVKCDAPESNQIENITSSALQVISKPAIPAIAKLPDTSSSLPVFQTRWTCEICKVTVSSKQTLKSHIRGKRHRAEAKLWCDYCSLRVSSEINMIAHLKGKRHLAKLREKRHRAEAKLWCDYCSLRVSGEIDMIAHLKGKRHLAKLQEAFANVGAS